MTKLMYATYQTKASDLPRTVAIPMVAWERAMHDMNEAKKAFDFYKRINGTGMSKEDSDAMFQAQLKALNLELDMWNVMHELDAVLLAFNADPQSFWDAQQRADEENALDTDDRMVILEGLRS